MTGVVAAAAGLNSGSPRKLIDIINGLSLTSGLQLCLDVGDVNSYAGTGQQWSDVSGQGNHYNRGATSSAEASDPTFNGTAGDPSESTYWSFDGADYFSPANTPTWDDNLHKANGAATFLAVWMRTTAVPGSSTIFANADIVSGNAQNGVIFEATNGSPRLRIDSTNTSGSGEIQVAPPANNVSARNRPSIAISSYNLATPGGTNQIDGVQAAAGSLVNSTNTTNPSSTPKIGIQGSGTGRPMVAGDRLYCVAVWNTRLTDTQMNNLRAELRARFTAAAHNAQLVVSDTKTITLPSGINGLTLNAKVWGDAGAGGQGHATGGAGGGASGAYCESNYALTTADEGDTLTAIAGDGGNATAGDGNPGNGSSLVNATFPTTVNMVANGGLGGKAGNNTGAGGLGQSATGGNVTNTPGANGQNRSGEAGGNGGTAPNGGGAGGAGNLGTEGSPSAEAGKIPGGGGGGGGGEGGGSTGGPGAAGAIELLIV